MVTATKQSVQNNSLKNNGNKIACRKCKSTQVVANKRGYSFGIMFRVLISVIGLGIVLGIVAGLLLGEFYMGVMGVFSMIVLFTFLSVPISFLCGFIDRSDIVNGCMNCGNKWIAGKK